MSRETRRARVPFSPQIPHRPPAAAKARFGVFLVAALTFPWSSAPLAEIVITEINYDPVDDTGTPRPDLEFVEIFNDGPEDYDLRGYHFVDGIQFEITKRVILAGRSYLVICRDVDAVQDYYGISNAEGNFLGALENAGEDVEFANPQGAVVTRVRYNDRGKWPSGAKGAGHTLSLRYEYSDPSEPESWTISAQMGGTPGRANFGGQASFQDTILIDVGETWRYLKGTQAPPSTWDELGFSDDGWLSGPTGIGYGDGDDATVLNDMEGSYLTVFCRKTFTMANQAAIDDIDDLILSITVDDGFMAYLNGTQVASFNVGDSSWDAPATGTVSNGDLVERDITSFKNRLQVGTNVLAVQVHNTSLGSSDLSFIPRLVSRKVTLPEDIETVPVVVNEGLCLTDGERFVELYNTSGSAVDLSGFLLTDDFLDLGKYRIPDGTTIPARGFLSFTESELGLDLAIIPGTKERVNIALSNPAGLRVVDARIFEGKVDGKSEARLPDGALRFAPAAEPTPGDSNRVDVIDDVIFNEIMYNPSTRNEQDGFIEFYNRGDEAVDLGGWRVDGVGLTIPVGTVLDPDAYLVVARNPRRIATRYGLDDSVLLDVPWSGNLRNRGERLNLIDLNGNVADSVRYYDGGDWSRWADGGGSSLELIDPMSDNDVALSWDASDNSEKGIAGTITYGPVPYGGGESDFGMMLADEGIAIIDDISLVRTGSATNLISNPTFDSSTSGWRIEGTHVRSGRTTHPEEVISGNGSLKLICWNGGGDYKVNRIETDTARQSSGTYMVSFKARWIVGSPRIITIGDYSVGQPSNPGLAGSNMPPLVFDLGTPGAINGVTLRQIERFGTPNIGPSIDLVSHSPGVPQDNETVTVTARVRDPDGVGSVNLYFRTNSPAGSFARRTLSDADGDGVYTGTIPGQALETKVLFYIEATDGEGLLSRYPPDLFERTHPPVVNPSSPAANEHLYCLYRHDTRLVNTSYHSYRFALDDISLNSLATRKVLSNHMLEGTFIFGTGDVYYNSKIRYVGSPWLRPGGGTWGKSYHIKLPRDKPLHGRKLAFNLDNHSRDGRERLAHYLLRLNAGHTRLPYFDFQALVRFQLNDVRDASYEALDKPNHQYLSFWYPGADDGSFFEIDDRFSFNDGGGKTGNAEGHVLYPPYGSTSGGSNKENYRWFFNPRTGAQKTLDDYQPLQQMCSVMDPRVTPNASFDSQIWNTFDVEELLRVWAIELNIDDWDTWAGRRGKNAYLYRPTDDYLWRKVPWDLELTYGDVNAFSMPGSYTSTYSNHFSEITRMLNRPRIKRLYYGILAEMVDADNGFFHSDYLWPYLQRVAADGVNSLNRGGPGGFIDQRASRIRSWIRTAVHPQVRLTITTNGGNPVTVDELTVNLEGQAPADVFSLVPARNGFLVQDPRIVTEFSNSNVLGWSLRGVPLAGGTNTIEVFGFDSRGNIIDSDSIEIRSTVNWDPPSLTEVSPPRAAVGDEILLSGSDFHKDLRVVFGNDVAADEVFFDELRDPEHVRALVPAGLDPGNSSVSVQNADGKESDAVPFEILPPTPKFVRGDANLDEVLDVSDALKILFHLFDGLQVECEDALDANDSGDVNITDALFLLDFVFKSGAPPGAPYPRAGTDPTREDPLGCEVGLEE